MMENAQENTACENEIDTVLKLLKEGDEKQFRASDDVIMFLGNTGAGKSTLTQFLCGRELFSQEVIENSGEFVIIDTSEKISYSTITSKTLYPDLLVDEKNNTAYYDCPGFNDTRSVAHDICSTYFNKKLIDLSKNVKIVFVVGYPAVRRGVDRQDFVLLIKHATNFIKNVEKFKDSVALVVTKVDNSCVKKDGILRLVTDDVVLQSIVDFLKEVTRDWYQVENANEEGVKLVNAFLTTDKAGCYTKIALLRRPDENGEVKKISLLTDGKTKIEKVLRNLKFAQKNENDFGYTISADSKNCVFNLSIQLNKIITTTLINIGIEVQNKFNAKQTMCIDIDDFQEIFQNLQQEFCDLRRKLINGPPNLNNLLLNNEIKPFKKYLEIISRYCEHLNLLQKISGIDTCNSKEWAQGLDDVIDYFSKLYNWYGFIRKLHVLLSQFEIQKNINQYDTVDLINKIRTHMNKTLGEIAEFDLFMNKIDLPEYNLGYNEMKKINMDEIKLKTLTRLLELHLNQSISASLDDDDTLVIKGFNIKLSDVKENNYFCDKIKYLKIFAMNKIFIDSDWDLTDKKIQMCVIAPAWEVVGEKTIELSGAPGKNHPEPDNCEVVGGTGTQGEPGLPGGSSGHFLGIGGHFYNERFLKIVANGGKGGPGQNGGNGGPSGEVKCEKRSWYQSFVHKNPKDIFKNFKVKTEKPGEVCVVGSDEGPGGNGGAAGKGGHRGKVCIVGLNCKPEISKCSNTENGVPGRGGDPGIRNEYKWVEKTEKKLLKGLVIGAAVGVVGAGATFLSLGAVPVAAGIASFLGAFEGLAAVTVPSLIASISGLTGLGTGIAVGCNTNEDISDSIDKKETEQIAAKGLDGDNSETIQYPEPVDFINNRAIPYYKSYVREIMSTSLRKKYLTKFLNDFDSNDAILEMDDIDVLYFELKELQNQLKLPNTVPLLGFYKNLLKRMSKLSELSEVLHIIVLKYLYCATLSTIIKLSINDGKFIPPRDDSIIQKRVSYFDILNEQKKSYKQRTIDGLNNLKMKIAEKNPEKSNSIARILKLLNEACETGVKYLDKNVKKVPSLVSGEATSESEKGTLLLYLKEKKNILADGTDDEIFEKNMNILKDLEDSPCIQEENFETGMNIFLRNLDAKLVEEEEDVTFIRDFIEEMFENLKYINIYLNIKILTNKYQLYIDEEDSKFEIYEDHYPNFGEVSEIMDYCVQIIQCNIISM